jgi:hypothetical protein
VIYIRSGNQVITFDDLEVIEIDVDIESLPPFKISAGDLFHRAAIRSALDEARKARGERKHD